MINSDIVNKIGLYNEKIVKKQFEAMNYSVKRLDFQGKRKRPEFVVLEDNKPFIICEVKTIFSAGYSHNKKASLSTMDPNLLNSGVFEQEIEFGKIELNIDNAIEKYKCLIEDDATMINIPFVIVLFFDFFADVFRFYSKKDLKKYPEISGILKIEIGRELYKKSFKMELDKLKQLILNNYTKGLPPNKKEFILIDNPCAKNKLPYHFKLGCITN